MTTPLVEKRLILCYLFDSPAEFDAAWHALTHLNEEDGELPYLYRYGARLVEAPRLIADCRLLVLVLREEDLRDLATGTLCRLVDALWDNGASFLNNVPDFVTNWIAALSEWHEGYGPEPETPEMVALVDAPAWAGVVEPLPQSSARKV